MTSATDEYHDQLLLYVFPALIVLALVLTIGAEAAAVVFGSHRFVSFSPGNAIAALIHPGDPRNAWPSAQARDLPSALGYWTATILTLLVLGSIAVSLWLRLRKIWLRLTRFESESGTYRRQDAAMQTAAQMSPQAATERAKRMRATFANDPPFARSYGLFLGTYGKHELVASFEESILVIGPPRSGKTTSLVSPWIVESPGAVIATSTRPDVARTTTELRRRVNPVVAFDPLGISRGVPGVERLSWNPIIGCERAEVALRRANAMTSSIDMGGVQSGDFWQQAAAEHLAYVLHAAALGGASIATMLTWVGSPRQLDIPARILAQNPGAAVGWAERLAATSNSPAGQTTGSILAVLGRSLAPLSHPEVLATCSSPTAAPTRDLLSSRATIHLLSRSDQNNVAPLICALLTDILAEARDIAAQAPSGRIDPPLSLILDEAANIAPIPDLPALMATGGGESIVVAAVFQSLAQARGRWGDAGANALLDASTITLVLPGLSQDADLRALAALGGEVKEEEESKSKGAGGNSTTIATRTRAAIEPAELRELPDGHAYVLARRLPPAVIRLVPVWERPWAQSKQAGSLPR